MLISVLLLMMAETNSVSVSPSISQNPQPVLRSEAPFRKLAPSVEVKLARAFGTTETGSVQAHDLWLTAIQGGVMLTDVLCKNRWFGGNVEAIGLLMAGGQDSPEAAYFVGLNGGLGYHFHTGTFLDPFIRGSVGIAGTDAGEPDLGGKFQFNEQIGAGARFLLNEHHAITIEYAYWHVSNGGIREPNSGINAHLVSIGFAWLF
jgi:hypothetical protein